MLDPLHSSPAFDISCASLALVTLALAGCDACDHESAAIEETLPRVEDSAPSVGWLALDPEAAAGSLGLDLSATADGVIATWLEPHLEGHRQRFARLDGDDWSLPTTVAEAPDLVANWADFPSATRGGDGAIYVHHLKRAGELPHAYEIRLSRTRDLGESFEAMGVVHRDGTPTEHGFVSTVPTDAGIRMFWLDGRATVDEGGAMAVYTAEIGEEIGDAEQIDARVCDCCQTDAARTDTGTALVYRDREAGEVRDISIATRGEGEAGFSSPRPIHRDGWEIAGCPVNGPAIAADGRRVAVAWFTGAEGGAVHMAWSRDGGQTFGEPIAVDPHQPPGRVDVALTDGGAAVSWLSRSIAGGGAEVRVRHVSVDGALGAPTVVASTVTERASGFPILIRDGDRLLVAHRDAAEPPRVHVSALSIAELPTDPSSEPDAPEVTTLATGDALPAAHIRRASDEPVELASIGRGRAMVVAFYARWCQPCRDELRNLQAVRSARAEPDDVAFVAVSIDEGSLARAEAVARDWGWKGSVVRDADAAAALGVPPLPGIFAFGEDHTLSWSSVGRAVDEAEIADALTRIAEVE